MRLTIEPGVLALFPDAVVGVAVARNVRNDGEDPADAADLRRAEAGLHGRIGEVPVAEHPRIAAWREAYRRFGAKPKDHPSSVENLARRVLKGWTVPHVNRLVDIYNAVSLETLLPAGGEDLDAIEGDVALTLAAEGEPPVRLLGEPEARAPHPGEVIYRDRAGAICLIVSWISWIAGDVPIMFSNAYWLASWRFSSRFSCRSPRASRQRFTVISSLSGSSGFCR